MQWDTNDGGGQRMRGAARLSPAPCPAGVRPAHRHLHRVRHWAQRVDGRQEGVREQHYTMEEELHCKRNTAEPDRLEPHEQFNMGDAHTAEGHSMWVSGLWEMYEVGF